MIWGDHWTPKPPFFRPLVTVPDPFLFSSIFPPDQIGTSNCLILWDFSDSRSFCAVFPFLTIASPESLRLPGFSRLHSSPLVSLFWRRFALYFLSLYSQLEFTLCDLLVILFPSTFPTLLVTVETTHVCLSAWLPSS